jgi:hypothetical protein
MESWENQLVQGRLTASPAIKQKVAELTANLPTSLEKLRVLAQFMQKVIRYVAIELGIGGWQPHSADETFSHRYGDCKDKAALLATMLEELGIDSYQMPIHTDRGGVTPATPAHFRSFNHVILAVRLPDAVDDPSLLAVVQHPKLGRLPIFDPTDGVTPFGSLRGELQADCGVLVTPEGGELLQVPQLPASLSGVTRTGQFTLDARGRGLQLW